MAQHSSSSSWSCRASAPVRLGAVERAAGAVEQTTPAPAAKLQELQELQELAVAARELRELAVAARELQELAVAVRELREL
jgi:hypothetical protein